MTLPPNDTERVRLVRDLVGAPTRVLAVNVARLCRDRGLRTASFADLLRLLRAESDVRVARMRLFEP